MVVLVLKWIISVLLAWNAHTCSHQRHYQDNGRDLLTFEDLENLKLAEDLAKTYFEMYAVTSTGLAPEIAYFSFEVSCFIYLFSCFLTQKLPLFLLLQQTRRNDSLSTLRNHLHYIKTDYQEDLASTS